MQKKPNPFTSELPTLYADRIGEWYTTQTTEEHKSKHGQYLTPPPVASFMGGLASTVGSNLKILDPGAGSGILSCALCEALANSPTPPTRIELTCHETESGLFKHLSATIEYLKFWLKSSGIELVYTLHASDFILENAACIGSKQESLFYQNTVKPALFDYIISNPPYFKIPKEDPRAKACLSVVYGQPNIYALFMAISAHLLMPKGELIYITPRSFAAGPYFRLFREKFFEIVRPLQVHLFGSRTEAFDRSAVLQENVILHAVRDDGWNSNPDSFSVRVSFSAGARDIDYACSRTVPMTEIIDVKSHNRFLHIPTSDEEQAIIHLINSWSGNLHKYGLEISTGPVVPFRATQFITDENGSGKVPLLWMQNVKPLVTTWPVSTRKQQYVISNSESDYILLPNRNYVLLRRFSAKEEHRRLTAAPYLSIDFQYERVGFENHLNYIYRRCGELSKEEAYGIAALLNCKLLDIYFRSFNGNTQVSATELRSIPLPPIKTIVYIGKEAAKRKMENSELDVWITDMLMKSQEDISDKDRGSTGHSKGTRPTVRATK